MELVNKKEGSLSQPTDKVKPSTLSPSSLRHWFDFFKKIIYNLKRLYIDIDIWDGFVFANVGEYLKVSEKDF